MSTCGNTTTTTTTNSSTITITITTCSSSSSAAVLLSSSAALPPYVELFQAEHGSVCHSVSLSVVLGVARSPSYTLTP